jgi:F-type H+-transporting ATPase subunit gamma
MPSLKEVRSRISSTISTSQITSAMKMVSAAKLRKAQDAIIQMRPFSQKLKEILHNLVASAGSSVGVFGKERNPDKVLVIAINSNRGLCGGFNANVIKAINAMLHDKYAEQFKKGNVSFLCIGKKASDFFKKTQPKLVSHNELWDKLNYDNVAIVMDDVLKKYASGEIDRVEIVYNQFKNAATQILITEQILPFSTPQTPKGASNTPSRGQGAEGKGKPDYIFEPDKEEIIKELIPYTLKVRLYSAMLDSFAAEHGARMTAMHKATDNATELLKSLRLTYNKARQASITKEILEIVGGAEAINN